MVLRLAKEAGRESDPASLRMVNKQLRSQILSLQQLAPWLATQKKGSLYEGG